MNEQCIQNKPKWFKAKKIIFVISWKYKTDCKLLDMLFLTWKVLKIFENFSTLL